MATERSLPAPAGEAAALAVSGQRYRVIIAGLTMLLHFTFGLSLFVVSPLLPPIMEEFGVNRSTASLLIGLVLLLQAATAIPGGMLGSRFSLKWVIAIGGLLISVNVFSFATPSFGGLLALRIVYGVASSLVFPNIGPVVMQWFPIRHIPLVNSLNAGCLVLGVLASTFGAGPLAEALGWRGTLSLFGAIALLGALAWATLGRTREGETEHAGQPVSPWASLLKGLHLLRTKAVLLIAVANAAGLALVISLTSWVPTYLHEVHGKSLSQAASLMGLMPLFGVLALLSAGVLSTRTSSRRPFLLIPGLLAGPVGFVAVLLGGTPYVTAPLLVVGFLGSFYVPVLLAMPMELPGATPRNVALVFGYVMLLGGLAGFLAPLAVGILADVTGTYLWGFGLMAVLSWGLAAAALMLPKRSGS